MGLLLSSFKQSLKISYAVLKDTSLYFGFYFLAIACLILIIFQASPFSIFLKWGLSSLSHAFTAFLVPYYAYKYSQGAVPEFWNFIRENVWPVVFAYIKAFFVILLFLLLLIIPGLYKAVRLSFLTETVLFDKQKQQSDLKQANHNTRRHFWLIVLLLISSYFISFLINLIGIFPFLAGLFSSLLSFVLTFYLSCFVLLWK
ncbi:MAG: hypothetical protein OXN83_01380, partial [Oligoflexia bacterium]|nr:hypothetical protein [Oligoflexia bacterium]